jgi:hypothetical protein
MNLRRIGKNILLTICDADLLGKTLREGKIVFCVKEDFYRGKRVDVEDAVVLIENSTIVNMVGRNVVERAMEKGYVHPDAVLNIEGVPHAQIVKI